MKQILIYGDSLTWGIIPDTRKRLDFHERWPGVLEAKLNTEGAMFRVIENCLNGRRTVWEDPFKAGRNGLEGLAQVVEYNSPLEMVVVMLGTNDFQVMHENSAWSSAQGIRRLIQKIRNAPVEPGMFAPTILIVAPPPIRTPKGSIAPKFEGGETKSVGLGEAYRQVSEDEGVFFLAAGDVTESSEVDGIHPDVGQHRTLGEAVFEKISAILSE